MSLTHALLSPHHSCYHTSSILYSPPSESRFYSSFSYYELVFFWGFGVLFLSCVCVGVGGVVLCQYVCVCVIC